uniref:C-CAP/cofactor C-like domain-containing protein n=1 Tax=Denticeps clupeoides TaxID=299321 RepID=A0AAY3ZV85_9TELE
MKIKKTHSGVADDFRSANMASEAKLPERLRRRDQQRQEEAERRRDARQGGGESAERGDVFSAAFSSERAAIEELLRPDAGDAAALEEAAARTRRLQRLLTDSAASMAQYELKQAQEALRRLQGALDGRREELLPKKKFAFRSRRAAGTDEAPPGLPERPRPAAVDGAGPVRLLGRGRAAAGVDGVRLLGAPSTVHIKHVRDCEVLCGPVSGSVLVDQCSGCTLAVPCQASCAPTNTTDTHIYLQVASRAIIEDCSGLGFAPFTWTYPGLDADFALSGLDRRRNNWDQVDDFNWLAAGRPSPNWSVVPESERRVAWEEDPADSRV